VVRTSRRHKHGKDSRSKKFEDGGGKRRRHNNARKKSSANRKKTRGKKTGGGEFTTRGKGAKQTTHRGDTGKRGYVLVRKKMKGQLRTRPVRGGV